MRRRQRVSDEMPRHLAVFNLTDWPGREPADAVRAYSMAKVAWHRERGESVVDVFFERGALLRQVRGF